MFEPKVPDGDKVHPGPTEPLLKSSFNNCVTAPEPVAVSVTEPPPHGTVVADALIVTLHCPNNNSGVNNQEVATNINSNWGLFITNYWFIRCR
ncbi:MAG: hypothetical protein COA57_13325 [Flavobacteriales bacterium]|nr:MAG: hypothetical protein COA57_13325 [Flavobacteriales bacterium]